MGDRQYSRRELLAGGIGGAAALGLAGLGGVRASGAETVRRAARVKPAGGDLGAVEHVVFLMQENRSFDHYFGALGGVAGFSDTNNQGAFQQAWPGGQNPTLLPFHMKSLKEQAECTYDLSHSWPAEHASWNGGAMDSFVSTHTSNSYEGELGTNTMGYYKEVDLPLYYHLANTFTICDHYFCSVLGPTHPNRLMQISGTIDPAGEAGGPIIVTNDSKTGVRGSCSWTTMPEVLQKAGISWKVYNPHGPLYDPSEAAFISNNMLVYFDQYMSDPTSALYQNAFGYFGPNVTGGLTDGNSPNDLAADVAAGTLPQVSWICTPAGFDEHPPAPPALGEWWIQQILNTLLSNPAVWAKTVLFIMYDENDGFFDHVPPPTPPAGTPGEYLTVDPLPSSAGGTTGPVGLGVRVPMLVVSPFSAGGYVCSDPFDHTSQLRFLETLFGVTAPNISAWRRGATGDLTSALPVLGSPVVRPPTLPVMSSSVTTPPVDQCSATEQLEINPPASTVTPFAIPKHQVMPVQPKGRLKRTTS
jgi:phospholipase C